jgi:hypothetical protein
MSHYVPPSCVESRPPVNVQGCERQFWGWGGGAPQSRPQSGMLST